jgi:hypothetical protein
MRYKLIACLAVLFVLVATGTLLAFALSSSAPGADNTSAATGGCCPLGIFCPASPCCAAPTNAPATSVAAESCCPGGACCPDGPCCTEAAGSVK